MNKSDLDNIKKNIEAAKEVNMDRITLSLTLEEAEELIRLFKTYSVEITGPDL